MKMNYSKPIASLIIIIGCLVLAAISYTQIFDTHIFELQIAMGLAGIGIICTGIVQLAQVQDKKQEDKKFEQIMSKLNEIQQELEKLEQPKGSGVAIADILGAGLKYYAEHINKAKEEEKND